MKLDRNLNPDGRGKYALLKLRKINELTQKEKQQIEYAINILKGYGVVDYGGSAENAFFVIRLKDVFAAGALIAYAGEIGEVIKVLRIKGGDTESEEVKSLLEYQSEIIHLAEMASQNPMQRIPD